MLADIRRADTAFTRYYHAAALDDAFCYVLLLKSGGATPCLMRERYAGCVMMLLPAFLLFFRYLAPHSALCCRDGAREGITKNDDGDTLLPAP